LPLGVVGSKGKEMEDLTPFFGLLVALLLLVVMMMGLDDADDAFGSGGGSCGSCGGGGGDGTGGHNFCATTCRPSAVDTKSEGMSIKVVV
jgi:hypothetical protein